MKLKEFQTSAAKGKFVYYKKVKQIRKLCFQKYDL